MPSGMAYRMNTADGASVSDRRSTRMVSSWATWSSAWPRTNALQDLADRHLAARAGAGRPAPARSAVRVGSRSRPGAQAGIDAVEQDRAAAAIRSRSMRPIRDGVVRGPPERHGPSSRRHRRCARARPARRAASRRRGRGPRAAPTTPPAPTPKPRPAATARRRCTRGAQVAVGAAQRGQALAVGRRSTVAHGRQCRMRGRSMAPLTNASGRRSPSVASDGVRGRDPHRSGDAP